METNKIYQGDSLAILKTLEDKSVQCCVTSPPYYGLRDYGTATWEGGDPACDHKGGSLCSSSSSLAGYTSENVKLRTFSVPMGGICSKCGAVRIDDQIGLEETPEEYVKKLVEIFGEVKRVLKDDGTLWLNLGDSYAGSGKGIGSDHGKAVFTDGEIKKTDWKKTRFKAKDLIGIPWMVAFALRADGWYLRQDIIWHKPNPMPESVTDRCTKSHEYIFLLSKSAKYYYDNKAIQEPVVVGDNGRYACATWEHKSAPDGRKNGIRPNVGRTFVDNGVRNKRSVWTITTKPYAEAHFATFPTEIPETCIKAGTREGDIVLDPFFGAGTSGLVAKRLNREFIGLELNPQYCELAKDRIDKENGLFGKVKIIQNNC